jgi:hypothetical protein
MSKNHKLTGVVNIQDWRAMMNIANTDNICNNVHSNDRRKTPKQPNQHLFSTIMKKNMNNTFDGTVLA